MLIRLDFTMHIKAKAMPINDADYSCHIMKSSRIYSTNHIEYISGHHLLIASGQRHTHKHTDVHTKAILRNQKCAG